MSEGRAGAADGLVAVAVDAPGTSGGRLYDYRLPEGLADLRLGEAVIVPFGRRQAIGVVLGPGAGPPAAMVIKTVLDRVRTDGPILPPLGVRLARHVAETYLAPAATVIRQMLPPGFLEQLELYVVPVPGVAPAGLDGPSAAALAAAPRGGLPVRALPTPAARRPAFLRQLHAEARAGRLRLAWVLRPAEARPRLQRRVRLTPAGQAALVGSGPAGTRLGPRQRALLEELGASELSSPGGSADLPAARLAERHGGSALSGLVRRGLVALELAVVARRPLADRQPTARPARPGPASLSEAQAAAAGRIVAAVEARRGETFLLEGTTASGKTAVYLAAVEAALAAGRSALLLVPEIALAAPLLDRLRDVVDGGSVALLHSAMGEGERADEWRRIRAGSARVVVGTRLAVLAPLADPGVIVVDEEHDGAYKSDRTPRYQARDVAVELGRSAGAPVVLGSATPDVVSVGRAREGRWTRLELPDRMVGQAPEVTVVDLRAELAVGNRGLISGALAAALGSLDRAAGERAILVLNRRGSASVVLCRDCGYVQVCPECHRPLVYHAAGLTLRCHHCGASAPVARRCPACGSARIRYLGGGTERLEAEVRERFPELRSARLDRDVTERKGAAERIIDTFTDGGLDVLLGTSLVTKGLDVPEVTLVGVVSADIALNLPDERAAERTYQLLRQAIGRAGRGERSGRAIIQTYLPDHPAIRAVAEDDAVAFYDAELAQRRAFGSPPFGRLVKLTVADPDRAAAEAEGARLAGRIRERAAAAAAAGAAGGDTVVLGPAPAYVARRGGRWRFHLVLRGAEPLLALDGDPGPPWSVDVDPDSLL
ncbi:MAG: primosomal protein N' [Chloroflexota bacterium]|nr:MAG: primosomal protein N' [Chloroflexota bacterium]